MEWDLYRSASYQIRTFIHFIPNDTFCYLATFNKTNIEFDRLSPNAAMLEDRYDWLEKNRPIPINCNQPNISISNMLLIKIVLPQRIEHKFDIPSLYLSASHHFRSILEMIFHFSKYLSIIKNKCHTFFHNVYNLFMNIR